MNPALKKHLHDMLGACRLNREFSEGRTWADYEASPLLRSAVERQFHPGPRKRPRFLL